MRSSGQAFGPSTHGIGRIGMGFHEQAADARRDGGAGQDRHMLALAAGAGPLPARQLHAEWVASNTTGQPVSRMIARLRMSETRLL